MIKTVKKLVTVVIWISLSFSAHAQLGNSCGIPQWDNTKGYASDSYVLYNDIVYTNSMWSQSEEPGVDGSWVSIGACNEQLLIDNPSLAYTNCSSVDLWDNTVNNYNTDDLVNYNYGVYRAKYWVAGTEQPDTSDAYEYLGVCIVPIEILPVFSNGEVILQSTLQTIGIEATLNTNGFTAVESKIRIKKTTDSNYTEYSMTENNSIVNYNWLPSDYGDYNLQYYSKNSVNVESTVNIEIKVAASTPPNVVLNSPASGDSFIQLNFSPIDILFTVTPTDNSISSISFKDITAGVTSNIQVVQSNSSYNYTVSWTPQNYGINKVEITVTDTAGTQTKLELNYIIIDPTIENLSFGNLPYQIKAVHGIIKEFHFDENIAGVKSRNYPLTNFSFNNTVLTVESNNPGRTGLEITLDNGDKHYVGLRIDNADGSIVKSPPHISIGSVSEDITDDVNFFNNGINNTNLMLNNRMDVRYTYINGGPLIGWNTWQPDRAIKFARNSLKMGLVPYFIFYNIPDGGESYTTNLSHIQDPDYMTAYFENLDLFLGQVRDVVGDEFFGVIFEPDFLGYMQQNNEPPTLSTSVGANTIATGAGTLKTLVERINFEIDKKRTDDNLNLEFGWQLNLWAKPNVAGIRGIIRETDNATTAAQFQTELQKIKQTAIDIFQYGNTMGIMSNNADFISIDKYGLDALGYSNGSSPSDPSSYTWFWNNDHWLNYFEFVKSLYEESGVQVILWQIPVGHINGSTTTNEYTGTDFTTLNNTSKHYEDSASTFFFGDTVDFSNDAARLAYFSENQHNDPKLQVNGNLITFGNHFEELNDVGVRLVLMGAGVGDSTDGIGDPVEPGATLTDDHFWIQKVQDYYINHLTQSVLGLSEFVLDNNNKDYLVFIDENLNVKSLISESSQLDIFLFDLLGQKVLSSKSINIDNNEVVTIDTSNIASKNVYICLLINKQSQEIHKYKLLKP